MPLLLNILYLLKIRTHVWYLPKYKNPRLKMFRIMKNVDIRFRKYTRLGYSGAKISEDDSGKEYVIGTTRKQVIQLNYIFWQISG